MSSAILMVRRRSCAVSNHGAKCGPSALHLSHASRRGEDAAPQDEVLFSETAPLSFLFVLAVGLVAGTISGIVGTGSPIIFMPVLGSLDGPEQGGAVIGSVA